MAAANRPPTSVTVTKLIGVILVTGALVAGVMLPAIGGIGLTAKTEADKFLNTACTVNETASPTAKTTVLAADGKTVLAQFFAQNRTPVQLSQIPVMMQKALVDTEDRRFYQHHGVDIRGVLRAAVHNDVGGNTQGASTLTMQYVKQLRYYLAKNNAERAAAIAVTLSRKIEDAKCAVDLEQRESKQQILQNYFNIAFFGQNSYGVESAAATYFGKDVSQLTLSEAAMIVGLVQSPTAYNPFINPNAALARRNVVIDNMVTAGDLTQAQATAAKAAPIGLVATSPPPVAEGCAYANPAVVNVGFFCDYVTRWLTDHGLDVSTLQRGGYTIKTTLDAGLQTSGQNAVYARGIAPTSPMTLIMPSVDPKTGNITTMISSRQYGAGPNQTSIPLFTDAYAGSGSTFKFFTAITALESGLTPSFTMTAGAPYYLKNCPRPVGQAPYVARNAGNYAQTLRLGQALPQSVNTWFVGLEDMFFNCDVTPIVDTAKNLGMTGLNDPKSSHNVTVGPNQVTFTLGQTPTSALELTSAFATAANDGIYCPPTPVLSVTDSTGKDVPIKRAGCVQKIDPQVARYMTSMMVDDTRPGTFGTANSYFRNWYASGGSLIASKTGTNNSATCNAAGNCVDNNLNSALWFVGITPSLASAAAIVDYQSPNQAISQLPGFANSSLGDTFGAYASTYWLNAYEPTLIGQKWNWPSPDAVAGNPVPNVTGQTPAAATAMLQGAGYKANILSYACGSAQRAGTLSGFSPSKAPPGATITACVSNGRPPAGSAGYAYNPRQPAPGGNTGG